ncbi:hypothetical protein MRY82_09725 [bacterium]|nr:hypothetical protein [bacterium]
MTKTTKKHNISGFTLVELFVSMLIVASLAAVAIPVIQRYLQKAKQGEASLKLKQLYDSQMVFYNEQPFLYNANTPCLPNPRFSPVSSFHCLTKECDAGEDMNDFSVPPAGRKGYLYAYSLDGSQVFTNDSCDMVSTYEDYGVLGLTNLGATAIPLNSGISLSSNDTIISINGDSAGYFNLVAFEDPAFQAAVGANNGESMLLVAYADTDGEYVAPSQNAFLSSLLRDGSRTHPFNIDEIWSMSRGIYIDAATNEVKGTEGIFQVNEGE